MALGIPLPLAPDVAFGQGLKGGADFYHQLVQHAISRAQERRAQEKLPYETINIACGKILQNIIESV